MKIRLRNLNDKTKTVNMVLPISDNTMRELLNTIGLATISPNALLLMTDDENSPIMNLVGREINVDELNFLAKRLERLNQQDLMKYKALLFSNNYQTVMACINLTYSLERAAVVSDFSGITEMGKLYGWM